MEKRGGRSELLATGLQNADQDALGACSLRGAIPTPYLAGHDHGTDCLFGAPVSDLQPGAGQESEQGVALANEMVSRAPIPWRAIATLQNSSSPVDPTAASQRH